MGNSSRSTLVFLLLTMSVALAGTRIFSDLEAVLRGPSDFIVFSAVVESTEFRQAKSHDILKCQVLDLEMLAGQFEKPEFSGQLQFSAYRPAPDSTLRNHSVYSDGSGLEFGLQEGQRYIFICTSSRNLVRVEPLESQAQILKLLQDHKS